MAFLIAIIFSLFMLSQPVVAAQGYQFIKKQAPMLNPVVADKAITALKCARRSMLLDNGIYSIIDFSLPSDKKRIWIFDLVDKKLLFHTYLSHGIKSGVKQSTFFSNRNNSKASSIGLFQAENSYYGRYGYSLKLRGLDKKFNHNAYSRFIVLHGSWYTHKDFVKKYGRAGRSWGCPSVPRYLIKPVVNSLKNGALIFAYYPSNDWLHQSEFLNCDGVMAGAVILTSPTPVKENRAPVLFGDLNNNNKRDIYEPVVAISADRYRAYFQVKPPVKRMLRRQVNKKEFIVLTQDELRRIVGQGAIEHVYLLKPEVKKLRGYWATEFKPVDFGKKTKITKDNVVFYQKGKTIQLLPTKHFIRWLGL